MKGLPVKVLLALVSLLGLLVTVSSAQRTTTDDILPKRSISSVQEGFRRAPEEVTPVVDSCPALLRASDTNSDGKLSQEEYLIYVTGAGTDSISGGDFRNVFSLKFGALPSKLKSIFYDLSCTCARAAYSATGGEAATTCCDGAINIAGESPLVEETCIRIQLAFRNPVVGRSSSPQMSQDNFGMSSHNLGRQDGFAVPVIIPNSFVVSNVIGITASQMVPGFTPHDDLQLGYDILSEHVVDFFNDTFTTFQIESTVLAEIYDMDCPEDIFLDSMLCQSVFATMQVELTDATANATALAEVYSEGMQVILDFGFLNDVLQLAPSAPIFIAENGTDAVKPGNAVAPSPAPLAETSQPTPAPSNATAEPVQPSVATTVMTGTTKPSDIMTAVGQNITVSNEFVIYNNADLRAFDMIPNSPSYNALEAAYALFLEVIYDEIEVANFQKSAVEEIVDIECSEGTESGTYCQLVVANHTIDSIDPQVLLTDLAALGTNATKLAIATGTLQIVLRENFPESPIHVWADAGNNQQLIISNSFVIANNQSIVADILVAGNGFIEGLTFAYELMNGALYLGRNQSEIFFAVFSTVVEEVLDVPCPDTVTGEYLCQSILATYGVDLEPLPANIFALQQNLTAMTEDAIKAGTLQVHLIAVDGSSPFLIIADSTAAPTQSPVSVPTNNTLVEMSFSISSYLLVSTAEPLTNAAVANTVGTAYSNLAEIIVQSSNNSTELGFTGTLMGSSITSTGEVACAIYVVGKTCYVVYAGYNVSGVGQSGNTFASSNTFTQTTNELLGSGGLEQLINQSASTEQQYSIDSVLETKPVTIVTEFAFAISLPAGAESFVGSSLLVELADVVGEVSISLSGDASASLSLLSGTGSVDDIVGIDCPAGAPVVGTSAPITTAPITVAPVPLTPNIGTVAPVDGGVTTMTAAPITEAPLTIDTMAPAEAPIGSNTEAPATSAPAGTDTKAPATSAPISTDTDAPATSAPIGTDTEAPATSAPISIDTEAPVTTAPISTDTEAPATTAPVGTDTEIPTTSAPISIDTEAPATSAPVGTDTEAPATISSTSTDTEAPVTSAPVGTYTEGPATTAPISTDTEGPASTAPVGTDTEVPATSAPISIDTEAPATSAPVGTDTEAPATSAPISGETEAPATSAPVGTDTEAPATSFSISTDTEAPATNAPIGTDTGAPVTVNPVTAAPVTSAPFDAGENIGRARLTSSTRTESSREGRGSPRLLMRILQDDLNQTDGTICFACYGSYEVLLSSLDNGTSLQQSITNGFESGISTGELQNAINSITGLSTSILTILSDDEMMLSPPTSAPTTNQPSSSPQPTKLEIETAFILASSTKLTESELQSSQLKTALAIAFGSVAQGVTVDSNATSVFVSANITMIEETACPSGNEEVEVCYLVYGSYSIEVLLDPDANEEAIKQIYGKATEESIDNGLLETFLKNVDAQSPFVVLEGLQPSAITQAPSSAPAFPSTAPSGVPSTNPSLLPTLATSGTPSRIPSTLPSLSPSIPPSSVPSFVPSTSMPSVKPTSSSSPSSLPSLELSFIPSEQPSSSSSPTLVPTAIPSGSSFPSGIPSGRPSGSQRPSFGPSLSADSSLINKVVPNSSGEGLSGGATAGIVIGILLLVLVCVVGGYFGWQYRDDVKEKIPFLKTKDDCNDTYGEDVLDANAKDESLALARDDAGKDVLDDMTDDDADVSHTSSSGGQPTPSPIASTRARGGLALFSLFRGKKRKEDDAQSKVETDIENPDPLDKARGSELDGEESSRSLFFGKPDEAENMELHTDGESENGFSDYNKSPVAKSRQAVVKESSHEHEDSESESDYESDGYGDDDNGKVLPANFKEVRSSASTAQTKNNVGGKPSYSDDDSYSGDSGSYSSRSNSSSSYYSEDDSGSDYTSESDTDRKKGRKG